MTQEITQSKSEIKSLSLKLLTLDIEVQPRRSIDDKTVSEYAEAIENGAKFPAVVVFEDGGKNWLASGFHRYAAHEKAGKRTIRCDVRQGTKRDAILFAKRANKHGLRLTNEEKRMNVDEMLQDDEWGTWGAREIARHVGVSHNFVSERKKTILSSDDSMEAGNPAGEVKFIHPKTGEVSTMNTANIGQKSEPQVPADDEEENRTFAPNQRVVCDFDPDHLATGRILGRHDEKSWRVAFDNGADVETVATAFLQPILEDVPDFDDEDAPTEVPAETEPEVTEPERENEPEIVEPSLDEQIEATPLFKALSLYGHSGRIFFDQARIWEKNQELLRRAHAATRALEYTTGPVTEAIRTLAAIPHWSQWQGCPQCFGSLRVGERADPCPACKGGFTVHPEQGVKPDVIVRHATDLSAI